jgi:CubicO group peptidase (beta-lactamase class C family)
MSVGRRRDMVFTETNLRYRLAITKAEWIDFRNSSNEEGFRTHALTLSGSATNPLYTGVMVKRATPFRGQSVLALSESGLDGEIGTLASEKQLHPYIIAATGPATGATYAAAFREASEAPEVKLRMTGAQFIAENLKQHDAGRILISFDSFGSATEIRYCALWGPNPDRVAWNADGLNDLGDVHQQRFDAMRSMWARQALVAMTPAGGFASLYVDSRVDSWFARPSLTREQMDREAALQADAGGAGRFPVCIGAVEVGGQTLFSPIFASGDSIQPKTWRVRGPVPQLTNADKIDTAMETFLKDVNVRGAALAIVEGTRLVYTKGYTLAEASYPEVLPTTLFRQASVAKLFCALAMWRLMANEQGFSRDTTLQSVLNLRPPSLHPKIDKEFSSITMRHLLESNSGINQGSVWDTINQRRDSSGHQPMSADEIANIISGLDMPGSPGEKGKVVYGRTDYFLLSRVVAKKTGVTDFEQALKQVLLDPLHMTRTRGSRSLVSDQANDEARYHVNVHLRDSSGKLIATHLGVSKSVRDENRRLLPYHYGGSNHEVFDGAGGISSAVIDVARLCAMLACRVNNPILSSSVLDQLFKDAVSKTTETQDVPKSHGFHGFDGAIYQGATPPGPFYTPVAYTKGGELDGVRTIVSGVTGKRVYVVFFNGDMLPGVYGHWHDAVGRFADDVQFSKDEDMFEQYDMPRLGGNLTDAQLVVTRPVDWTKITDFEEEDLLGRR